MKNETLYNKTVDVLVQAYFNGTLQHGECDRCAVGNLCFANGYAEESYRWNLVFVTHTECDGRQTQIFQLDNYEGKIKEMIDSTGYTVSELAKIEYAFESADRETAMSKAKNTGEYLKWLESDEHMFSGLMAVIEVLDEIHGNTNTATTKSSKARFVRA